MDKQVFCVHVPMFCSKLRELPCKEVDGEWVPDAEAVQMAAKDICWDVFYGFAAESIGRTTDAWIDTDRPVTTSSALGSADIKSDEALDDCDGVEFEFDSQ